VFLSLLYVVVIGLVLERPTWVVVGIFLAALTTYIVVRPPYVEVYVGPKGEIVPTPTTLVPNVAPTTTPTTPAIAVPTTTSTTTPNGNASTTTTTTPPEPDHDHNDPKLGIVEHNHDNRRYVIDDDIVAIAH
jgi:hypothetical protein